MSRTTTRRAAHVPAILVFIALAGACGDSQEETPAAITTREEAGQLIITVSSAGGVAQGAPDGPFAGVSLDFPADAVDAVQTITLALDPALPALPELAEGIGQPFSISPAGLKLNKPVTLTLPVHPEQRDAFFSAPQDCKVWMREGEGWRRLEQTASTNTSVSVQTEALHDALAGTFRVSKVIRPTCDGIANARCMPISCNTPGQFCTEQLTQLKPLGNLTAGGKFIYFTQLANSQSQIARVDLDTKAIKTIPANNPACQTGLDNGLNAVALGERDGVFWLNGCRQTFDAQAPALIAPASIADPTRKMRAIRSLQTTNGETAHIFIDSHDPARLRYVRRVNAAGQQLSLNVLPLLPDDLRLISTVYAPDPASPRGIWTLAPLELGPLSSSSSTFEQVVDAGAALIQGDDTLGQVIAQDPAAPLSVNGISGIFAPTSSGLDLIHPTLHRVGDTLVTLSNVTTQRLLKGSLSAGQLAAATLTPPAASTNQPGRIQQALADSEGGIWAILHNVSADQPSQSYVVYFAPEGGAPFVLAINAQPLQLALADGDRVVVLALPDGSTDKTLYTARRVK